MANSIIISKLSRNCICVVQSTIDPSRRFFPILISRRISENKKDH